jgi:hypothetical protein
MTYGAYTPDDPAYVIMRWGPREICSYMYYEKS